MTESAPRLTVRQQRLRQRNLVAPSNQTSFTSSGTLLSSALSPIVSCKPICTKVPNQAKCLAEVHAVHEVLPSHASEDLLFVYETATSASAAALGHSLEEVDVAEDKTNLHLSAKFVTKTEVDAPHLEVEIAQKQAEREIHIGLVLKGNEAPESQQEQNTDYLSLTLLKTLSSPTSVSNLDQEQQSFQGQLAFPYVEKAAFSYVEKPTHSYVEKYGFPIQESAHDYEKVFQSSAIDKKTFLSNQYDQECCLSRLQCMFAELSVDVLRLLSKELNFEDAATLVSDVLAAPAICRHFIDQNCYRSDCRFSHDMNTPCKFWLKGTCTNDVFCRFKHEWPTFKNPAVVVPSRCAPLIKTVCLPSTSDVKKKLPSPLQVPLRPAVVTSSEILQGASPVSYAAVLSSPTVVHVSQEELKPAKAVAYVPIPLDLWVEERNPAAFQILDPLERFHFVAGSTPRQRKDVLDLHFQSTRTVGTVLEELLEKHMDQYGSVWLETGTGHHVAERSHQRKGGYLSQVVQAWLIEHGYSFKIGIDNKGHSGALLVVSRAAT